MLLSPRTRPRPLLKNNLPKKSFLMTHNCASILLCFVVLLCCTVKAQQQDPTTMNGGSVLAMAGKDCVALAVDKRFGSGPALVNIAPRHVLVPSPNLLVAFTGLEGDVQSLQHELAAVVANKYNRGLGFQSSSSRRAMLLSPRSMASLTSHVLYNRKRAPYFSEVLVVGVEACAPDDKEDDDDVESDEEMLEDKIKPRVQYRPYLCSLDMIGARSTSAAFVCAGAATQSIFGTAEALWKPELASDELVEVCGKAFLSALERDCLSGYGVVVYLITADGITEYDLASRND